MNFLLVVDSLLGGGAERMVLTLAKAMSSLGHVAIVYNLSGDCELKTPKGVMVIDGDFKIAAREAYRYRRKFNRSISDIESQIGKFDGIVGNLPLSEAFLHHASRDAVFVIHCVLSHHLYSGRGLLKRRRKRLRSQQRYKQRRLICCSNGVRDDLIENFSIRPEQCVTIYNPIDVQWVRQQASAPLTDDLPSGDYLLHVGSFSKVKRHDLLLEAYALSGVPGDLVLLGQGAELESARRLVGEMGIADKVHFLGFKENPYPYIKKARLMVLSSDSEALPTVLIEALACGTQIVSTATPGAKEILGGDLSSSLCRVGDVDSLAGKISEVWATKQSFDYVSATRPYEMCAVAKQYEALISG